ncbi:hypothetical protein LPU83_pLPU83d_0581 (plasmid) [Rhizobium favelukesii]|uniref:Nucleotidyltransferase-like domain-containing protein n=1 Tax=Rhizobium favelukesii TaxID=348824 RepID=W6RLI1_9HYPH|nr:hypothetical protein LPU83_pLPU83d_0581 [Rhizobium favelukesii]
MTTLAYTSTSAGAAGGKYSTSGNSQPVIRRQPPMTASLYGAVRQADLRTMLDFDNMPTLGGASAENLRFLDYLIYEPVRTVLLHREGVSVIVPAPERYAVHELIVASRRLPDALGRAKREKDLLQASLLTQALAETRQSGLLADAYKEAWDRGKAWQEAIIAGRSAMPDHGKAALAAAMSVPVEELGKVKA